MEKKHLLSLPLKDSLTRNEKTKNARMVKNGWECRWDAAQFFFSFIQMFLFCSFSNYKMDCYGYLTVCPSHFSPHLSSCELFTEPFFVYFYRGFTISLCFLCVSHCSLFYLYGLSVFSCHVHQAGGLNCTEQKNKRLGGDDLPSFKKKKTSLNIQIDVW